MGANHDAFATLDADVGIPDGDFSGDVALFPLGGAAGGWTSYPTLSTLIGSPGSGQTLWALAISLTATFTISIDFFSFSY